MVIGAGSDERQDSIRGDHRGGVQVEMVVQQLRGQARGFFTQSAAKMRERSHEKIEYTLFPDDHGREYTSKVCV
jgi:hypothetical protein